MEIKMSKLTTKIKRIKNKLDSIEDIEDEFIISNINKIDIFVNLIIEEIDIYLKENPLKRIGK